MHLKLPHPTTSSLTASALFMLAAAAAHQIDVPAGGHLLGTGGYGNIGLVGQLSLAAPDHLIGDVAVSPDGNWAFLANRHCVEDSQDKKASGPGIWIIDISTPANPTLAGFMPSDKDTRPGEGLQVVTLTTNFFSGSVLVTNSEPCGDKGRGGASIYDVTDPLNPQKLTEHYVATVGQGQLKDVLTDSAFAWDAGDNAYAALSAAGTSGFVIVDITNPRIPRHVAAYRLEDLFAGGINQPAIGLSATPITDIIVRQVGPDFVMLVSAGDGGHAVLNVTDPTNVVGIAHTDFTVPDPELLESLGVALPPEGNAHYAEFTANNAFLIGTDEDLRPFGNNSSFDGWGYVHLYSSTPVAGKLPELDTYAIPEAHNPVFAAGFGNLSVHEVATHPQIPDRAYLAYRQGGLRAVQIQGTELVETGGYLGAQGNDVWGVEVLVKAGATYIVASDREKGLYIFRDTSAGP